MIRVGTVLYGYCGGLFGRHSYGEKRVEAVGADWVVARDSSGSPLFYQGVPENLEAFTVNYDEYEPPGAEV